MLAGYILLGLRPDDVVCFVPKELFDLRNKLTLP